MDFVYGTQFDVDDRQADGAGEQRGEGLIGGHVTVSFNLKLEYVTRR